jgi:hypothetical protein
MKTKLVALGFALILSALVFSACGESSAEPAALPMAPQSVSNLLADPAYDSEVRIHGEVGLLGELRCPCFELNSGGKTAHVWYGLMVEDDGTEWPSVSVEGIENGDSVVVTGELKADSTFWASSIVRQSAAEPEYCRDSETAAKLSYQDAVEIAQDSECVEQGDLKETYICNESTGTWWIDLDIDKPGCNPACVVDVSDKTAEINWRCTGLVPPTVTTAEVVQYEVTINFNTSVTPDDLAGIEPLLRAYGDDLEYAVMESWPPIGRALLMTGAPDFCRTVEAELESESYIDKVTCEPWADISDVEPDAPVSIANEVH